MAIPTVKDDLEKSALAEDALDDAGKTARTKLRAALKQYEGPRPSEFVAQSQAFGGEAGEDTEGNKVTKPKKKGAAALDALASEQIKPVAGASAQPVFHDLQYPR